ncbi:MAG: right-handed parallel beta-helix repeat-containing protein, partial [Candidatus Thorarchaeota archaeon]
INVSVAENNYTSPEGSPAVLGYTEHGSISIDSDDDFITYGFLGIGTKNSPYLIENLNITVSSTDGIYIYGTTKHFIIQNCLVSGSEYGIYLREIYGTGIIRENFVEDVSVLDIGLWNSDNNLIEYNNASYEIDLSDSDYNVVQGNTAPIIDVEDSDNNEILDNFCIGGGASGIGIRRSDNTIISGNSIRDKGNHGIFVSGANNLTISNNECSNNDDGIYIAGSPSTVDTVVIEKNEIYMNADLGIYLYMCHNVLLSSNEIYSNNDGIYLSGSDNGVIFDNLLQSNTDFGIDAFGTEAFIIYHNTFKYNGESPQARDNEGGCTWYNDEINEGNYWSDWDGSGEYEIVGPPGTSDPYPLSESPPTTTTTPTTTKTGTMTVTSTTTTTTSNTATPEGFPIVLIIAAGGGAAIIVVAIVIWHFKKS